MSIFVWSIIITFAHLADAAVVPAPLPRGFPLQRVCQTQEQFKGKRYLPQRCTRIDQAIAKKLIDLYERLPDVLRREIWAIDRIYIYPSGAGPAAYTEVQNTSRGPRLVMGIKAAVFSVGLAEYLRNLDLKYFGVDISDTLQILDPVPLPLKVETKASNIEREDLMLTSTVIHELGHVVDLRYGIGEGGRLCFPDLKSAEAWVCFASPGGWYSLTWKYSAKFRVVKNGELADVEEDIHLNAPSALRVGSEYKVRPNTAQMTLFEVNEFYAQLRLLPVNSSYALTGPAEDFAESWADHWMAQLFNFDATFFLDRKIVFATRESYSSVRYRAKKRFILELVLDLETGRKRPKNIGSQER